MLSELHALETFGKQINVVTENARDQRDRLKQALHALKTTRASILDVFKHGFEERQRTNLARNDLPLLENAIKRLEQPSISAPKIQVPPSKFSPIARQIEDAAIKTLADAIEGPVACGGLLKGEDLDEGLYTEETTEIMRIDIKNPDDDDDPNDELSPDNQV